MKLFLMNHKSKLSFNTHIFAECRDIVLGIFIIISRIKPVAVFVDEMIIAANNAGIHLVCG